MERRTFISSAEVEVGTAAIDLPVNELGEKACVEATRAEKATTNFILMDRERERERLGGRPVEGP